ncbi:MAG: monovalent cation/H(+) antiporter subunit G [Actinobacteria bacterium]|nr:monovalent cation/H(+) antiporter subunit G [Actinomycetota bacterium]
MNFFGYLTIGLLVVGTLFFIAGTVGLLRFPDVYSRLHALTKADNLGLGLVAIALAINSSSAIVSIRLLITWLLVLLATATTSHLIARAARENNIEPWRRP